MRSSARRSRLDSFITRAAYGADHRRPLQLPAQLSDVNVHRARPARIADPPNAVEETVARENDARTLEEVDEQVELLRGQLHAPAAHRRLPSVDVDDDVAEAKDVFLRPR